MRTENVGTGYGMEKVSLVGTSPVGAPASSEVAAARVVVADRVDLGSKSAAAAGSARLTPGPAVPGGSERLTPAPVLSGGSEQLTPAPAVPAGSERLVEISTASSSESRVVVSGPGSVSEAITSSNSFPGVTFVFDARGGPELANVGLKGSFDPVSGRYDPQWNGGTIVPMHDDGTHGDKRAGDKVYTVQVPLDPNDPHTFNWGIVGDIMGKDGRPIKKAEWLVLAEEPLSCKPASPGQVETYAPITNHLMGVHRQGENGLTFRTWAPETGKGDLAAYHMQVDVYNEDGSLNRSLAMQKDEKTGVWTAELVDGFKELEGKGYRYSARNEKGEILNAGPGDKARPVAYADPNARFVQGPQRGLERIFVDPVLGVETGWYNASNNGGPNYEINPQWARFTVNSHPDADRVALVLRDEQGNPLGRNAVIRLLGNPALVPYEHASADQKRNVDILRNWQIDTSNPVTKYSWMERIQDDGSIDLHPTGESPIGNNWVVALNNFPALVGLKYEFQVFEKGKLVGDINGDGILQETERKATSFNDPYGNRINARPGGERLSLIKESSYQFQFDNVPRKETDTRRYAIYEAHVGSFMGSEDNAHAATFEDLIQHLDYVDKMGFNTVELMPVQEFGSTRDWGYTGDFLFAGAAAYGFEMPREEAVQKGLIRPDQDTDKQSVFITGTDAFKLFVDEAHKRGLNVLSDVVYNHISGRPDADNPLSLIDGDKGSFFKWFGQYRSQTPWGDKPAFSAPGVKEFFTNNAAQQLQEFHCDGMRFDFVQVLHDTGSNDEKREGMNTLRQINRTVQFLKPGTYTAAEDFTHNWLVAAPFDKAEWQGESTWRMEKKGMGFGGVWNDSFHHDLLGLVTNSNPEYNTDRLMGSLLGHKGVATWENAVVFSHSHDEVGNSGSWVTRAAAHSVKDDAVLQPYPRAMARTAAAITLTSAGVPMVWQGEELLSNSDFKHGMPSTWGSDFSWVDFPVTPNRLDDFKRIASLSGPQKEQEKARLSPEERPLFETYEAMPASDRQQADVDSLRAGQYRLYQDLVKLRTGSTGLAAHTPINRVYTHNLDRVLAYQRGGSGSDEFVVVSNFADMNRPNYRIDLPPGRWQLVVDTDDRKYGGNGFGCNQDIIDPSRGLSLPAGGTLVLKKVG